MRGSGRRCAAALLLCAAMPALSALPGEAEARPSASAANPVQPRGLILFIGDGMGWGALSIATILLPDSTLLSGAEVVGALSTMSHDQYVTDSAAGATALSTGRRTRNGWLNVDPEKRMIASSAAGAMALATGQGAADARHSLNLNPETSAAITTIAEEAAARGLAVGLVTTSTIVHATPAGFYAHVDDRNQYEEIAAQLVHFPFSLVAGGGRDYFLPASAGGKRKDGADLIAELRRSGVEVVATAADARRAPAAKRLALLYSADDPEPAGRKRPALDALVDMALNRLAGDPDGFFLMVEGAQIDWAEHDMDVKGIVPELADFDRAVAAGRGFAAKRPGTVVVTTADHDTGGPGLVQEDRPGAPLEIRYLSGEHTALLVPLLLNGAPARGWTKARHQTDLARFMRNWLLEGR